MPKTRMLMTRTLVVAVLMALAATSVAQTKGKQLYCWNDASGRKVCGDALPAEAADSARTVINARTGMQTGQVARALTAEERAAAEAQAAEAQRQAAADAARRLRELALVESYTTEADLRRAYQARIDLMTDTVTASQLGVASRRQSLLGLLRRASELELAGKPVDAKLAANILTQHAVLRDQQAILARQQRERASLDQELAQAVSRYRELKRPAAAPAATPAGEA
jgi:hypothetical protein